MKKWFLIFFLLLIMAISGCKWDSTLDIVTNSIAEDRISISKGEKDGVTCTLMCGYREEDYVLNGVSTNLIEFGVLTFSISGFTPFDYGEPTYVLNVGIDRFSGGLELNPYDSTLVADVEKVMNIDENVVAYLNLNGKTYEIHLNSISKQWQVTHSLALKTFVETYKKELKEHI